MSVLHTLKNVKFSSLCLRTAGAAGAAAVADHVPVPLALVPSSRLAAVSVKNQNRIRPTPSSSRATTADAAEERKEKKLHKMKKRPRRDEIDDILA